MFSFSFLKVYLKGEREIQRYRERESKREREGGRNKERTRERKRGERKKKSILLSVGLFLKCLLPRTCNSVWVVHVGIRDPGTWVISHCFLGCTSRELNPKWSNWDKNWFSDIGCQHQSSFL